MGRHLLKAYTRKQKIIASSSAEAELYAAALGATEAKGVRSMMCDLGFAVKPVLIIDECWNARGLDTVALLHICFPCHRAVVCT